VNDRTDEVLAAPRRKTRWGRLLATVALLGAVVAAAILVPLPFFYAYLPGPVRSIDEFIEVSGGRTYSSEGELYMTTVSVDIEVTFVDWVAAVVDPNSIVVRKEDVTGGASFDELERQQKIQMQESKKHAQEVALSALGLDDPTGDGARVEQLAANTPAVGVLREGDVILSVGGTPVETSCDVGRAIDQREPGDRIALRVRRDGEVQTLQVGTIPNPQDPSTPLVGIVMSDVNYSFDPGIQVEFASGDVAGPSAGLMFTLALYDRLTPGDLTGGRAIAGTGEIACDGGVGPIGGIEQKVAGAEDAGATIFLAPAANFAAAERAAEDIEVVSISNFDQAVEYLEGLR